MDELETLLKEFSELKDKSKYHKLIYDMLVMMYRERETDCIIDMSDMVDEMKKVISTEIKALKQHEHKVKRSNVEQSQPEKKVHFEEPQAVSASTLTKELNEAKIQLTRKQLEMLNEKTGKKKWLHL